tara:strand:+ start:2573 stop:3319 length:747 start_codon:yes stop_codon:yes gene_type:complete
MKTLSEEQLYFLHDSMTLFMIGLWILIIFLGLKVKNSQQKTYISYGLIGFAFTQEILDYVNRIFLDELYDFKLSTDLPLQFCVIGFYFSIFGIYMSNSKRKFNPRVEQFIFDCAYVLGFSGAFQALITVDLTGIHNMIGAFALNWAHTLIILNVLWLIFAYGKRFTFKGVINAFIFINVIIWPVGFINYLLDANYMFICRPPNVNSSFFIGEWPVYLLWLELIYFIYIIILYLPFKLFDVVHKQQKRF